MCMYMQMCVCISICIAIVLPQASAAGPIQTRSQWTAPLKRSAVEWKRKTRCSPRGL